MSDLQNSYNKPRRPSEETITYLRGLLLPLDVAAATTEMQEFVKSGTSTSELPPVFCAALSALDDCQRELSSLAGDELGSQCVELLAQLTVPYSERAARLLLSGCSGYHLFLATHRYGSHVVQTLLQLACSNTSDNTDDLSLHADAPTLSSVSDDLPSLTELLQGIVEELLPSASQLARHICGSHVLRTLLCTLGGVTLVSSFKGGNVAETGAMLRGRKKDKKKKKKKKPDAEQMPFAGTMQIKYQTQSRLTLSELRPSLEELSSALLGGNGDSNEPGELQELSCHSSAGPLLCILLNVLTYADSSSKEKNDLEEALPKDLRLGIAPRSPTFELDSLAHNAFRKLLCWEEGTSEQPHAGDIIYGMSGEPRGSHLLETLLRLSPDSLHQLLLKYGDFAKPSALQEYTEHDTSNFVVQTLFTTIRSKEQAETMLKAIEKTISSGFVLDTTKRRRGILWRAAECAAKYRVGQESLLKALRIGAGTLLKQQQKEEGQPEPSSTPAEGKKKKMRQKDMALELKECVALLLDAKPPTPGRRETIRIDAAGTRAIYHFLHFSPRLCPDILTGILELPTDDIVALSRDGLGSRCILDGILDGPVINPVFGNAIKSLFSALEGNWVSLAQDRIGHHTVKKVFATLPKLNDKAKLVEELAAGGNRMNGNAMGRSVSEACFVEDFVQNKQDWRVKVTKEFSSKKSTILEELSPHEPTDKKTRKRKRKRKDTKEEDSAIATQ